MKLNKILNYFQFEKNEITILGTYGDSRLKYYSDIDLQQIIEYNHKTIKPLIKYFKDIYNQGPSRGFYITDFKAGFSNGIALKWSLDEINQGYKEIDDHTKVYFYEVFTQKSIIKFDWICSLDGLFTEFSCNYYIYFNTYNTRPMSYNELSIIFYLDYKKYLKEQMYFKAIKRLFKFFIQIKDKVNINRIIKFLNSNIGFYSFILSHLENVQQLIEMDDDISLWSLKKSLMLLLKNTEFEKYTTRLNSKNTIILLINTISNMVSHKIQKASLDFLQQKIKSNHILLELYKHEH